MSHDVRVPKTEYQAVLRGVRRGIEICSDVARLRFMLRAVSTRLKAYDLEEVERAIKACEEVARLRVDLSSLERRLLEVDQELTPVRPPSRADIKAAFDNATDYAEGRKKTTRS